MSKNLPQMRTTGPQIPTEAMSSHRALSGLERLRRARDPFGLLRGMRQFCSGFGVRSALFVHAIPDASVQASHQVLLECDPRLASNIRNCDALDRHPWVRHAARSVQTVCASELKTVATPQTNKAVDLEGNGFRSALLIPVHGASGSGRFSLLCLGSPTLRYFEEVAPGAVRLLAEALAAEMHKWWMAETRQRLQTVTGLKDCDLKLLELELEGLGTKQIARALGLSCSSVDSRFQRINVKMGCASRRASALRASLHELI